MARCLLEWMADSLCLAMLLRLRRRRICIGRVLAAAAAGALGSRMLAAANLCGAWNVLLWLPLACGMAALAGGGMGLRPALLLFACEGLLGGTVAALAGALGSLRAAWALGAACTLMAMHSAVRERRMASDAYTVRIRVTFCGRTAAFDALVDSGNCLRDYLTHRPVIVLPDAARAALGLEAAVLRPIFADTAGGRQMMACFTPQETWVETESGVHAVAACAAFSPGLGDNAPALLPQALMREADMRAAQ